MQEPSWNECFGQRKFVVDDAFSHYSELAECIHINFVPIDDNYLCFEIQYSFETSERSSVSDGIAFVLILAPPALSAQLHFPNLYWRMRAKWLSGRECRDIQL